MNTAIFFGLIAVFAMLLFLNFYFRVKVLKSYRYLVQNRIDFNNRDFLDKSKMTEVYKSYPEHEAEIRRFVTLIRRSVLLASVLLALILIFGYMLIRNR